MRGRKCFIWNLCPHYAFFISTLCLVCFSSLSNANPWLTFGPIESTPENAPGRGMHIVFVSGDEEYRSEEAIPQLAAILSHHHGFDTTVLFAIDPSLGVVHPDLRTNIPRLEQLENADCLVLFTRFRNLPDEQMVHIDQYVRSGRPVLGIRTSTHAFNMNEESSFKHYSWDFTPNEEENDPYKEWTNGFGRVILGETWVAHHGQHGSQSTQGIVHPNATDHPITRGLGSPIEPLKGLNGIWGPSDVYRVRLPMQPKVEPIILGRVLEGMDPDSKIVSDDQNNPLMPVAWTKSYLVPGGIPGKSMTSTIGAATDLVAQGTRRLLVNGVYWLCGLQDQIPESGTDVRIVGRFDPTDFGFGGSRRGLLPSAFSPIDEDQENQQRKTSLELKDGDRVVLIGNTFAERISASGYFSTMIHASNPEINVSVRHIPWSADEVGNQPREVNVPSTMDRLNELDPTIIIACYGMSESFGGESNLDQFSRDLNDFLSTLTRATFSQSDVRVALVSPIRHEDLGDPWVTGPELEQRNRVIQQYVETMRIQADKAGVMFCDLFDYENKGSTPITSNGIHPNELGCNLYTQELGASFGWIQSDRQSSHAREMEVANRSRKLAADMYYHERLWYRPTNSEYVFGRRHTPFGIVNFPPEMDQLARMIDARDRALSNSIVSIDALFNAPLPDVPYWEHVPTSKDFPEDQWDPEPIVAEGTETSLGSVEIGDPELFLESFKLAQGYEVNLFASEDMFPELASPLAMAFDEHHRLWVMCAHTYPHLLPGEQPKCKLILIEDTDQDGVGDTSTIFADQLYIPTGFVVDIDSVYLGQAPDLIKLTDTDGDGSADRREVLYTGFSMPDSHHTISAFEWDPHGGFLMHEGIFGVTGIESPWGTLRAKDAAIWRFDTRTQRLTRVSHSSFYNPWGHAFDDYGQSILADASGGDNFSFGQVISPSDGLHKPKRGDPILHRGRPTAGCEILSSRHFPDDVQGTYLVNQCIGYHGTRWNTLDEPTTERSGWSSQALEEDLIESSDVNFRPVAMEIGPDGTLFLGDWSNPIIGHMQYSIRDPRRDSSHGRIWRIKHKTRSVLTPPEIPNDESIKSYTQLLELLRLPESNTRRHARRRLHRASDPDQVLSLMDRWIEQINPQDPLLSQLRLEQLWLNRALGRINIDLLSDLSMNDDARVRAGAIRVLRHWLDEGEIASGPALRILSQASNDQDMRVRLETVVASSFVSSIDAMRVVETIASLPTDTALQRAIEESTRSLGRFEGEPSDFARRLQLESMALGQLLSQTNDSIIDRVLVTREDVPIGIRESVAKRIVESNDVSELAMIILESSDPQESARAMAPTFWAYPLDLLIAHEDQFVELAQQQGSVGALGLGLLERIGRDAISTLPFGDPRLLYLLDISPPGSIELSTASRVLDETAQGFHSADRAVESLVKHVLNSDVRSTLESVFNDHWIKQAQGQTLADWDETSTRARAALKGVTLIERMYSIEDQSVGFSIASEADLALGKELYESKTLGCIRCHAQDGTGLEGFPPLAQSPWVHGDPDRLISIVLQGLYGQIEMPDGSTYNSAMAPLAQLINDQQIASILSYVRQSFGNFASPITPEQVQHVRSNPTASGGIWKVEDILRTYPLSKDEVVPSIDTDRELVTVHAQDHVQPDTCSKRLISNFMLSIITMLGLIVISTRTRIE